LPSCSLCHALERVQARTFGRSFCCQTPSRGDAVRLRHPNLSLLLLEARVANDGGRITDRRATRIHRHRGHRWYGLRHLLHLPDDIKPNLSAYERGKLLGRAIFEIVLAIAGTGIATRMGRFFAEIGQTARIIDRIGSKGRAFREAPSEAYKVVVAEKLLDLLNKIDVERRRASHLVSIAEKLFPLLQTSCSRVPSLIRGPVCVSS